MNLWYSYAADTTTNIISELAPLLIPRPLVQD